MKFLDRQDEMRQLDALAARGNGGLAVLWGRRRIGKTRLLLEWVKRHGGVYWVADESAPALQRRLLAQQLAVALPGFDEVDYPDWAALLTRLGRETGAGKFCGPLVIDELPYLTQASPELPSVLQRFVDAGQRRGAPALALAGSSQQMMQGLVLQAHAPLYGRASVLLEVPPLPPAYIGQALGLRSARACVEAYAAWGGVPRYWELAAACADTATAIEALVLDPHGVLSEEPVRLLREELPPAIALRPILDAIGSGAQRVSEVATRLACPMSSLARPLQRLGALGLVRRTQPFGCHESASKRTLYQLEEPLLRLWFSTVSPRRGMLAQASAAQRRAVLMRAWPHLVASTWEALCRRVTPHLTHLHPDGFLPGRRYWHGKGPEWDVVALSPDERTVLVGEAEWTQRAPTARFVQQVADRLRQRGPPPVALPAGCVPCYAVFVPTLPRGLRLPAGVHAIDAAFVIAALT